MKIYSQSQMNDAQETFKMKKFWNDDFFLIAQFSFLEWWSWRRSEDEVEKVGIFLIGGKIFSIKGALQNILLGLKDEWECTLDASTDKTKANSTNEVL